MKVDFFSLMREYLRAYHSAEQGLITTNPTLIEQDEENYSDSCKWLRMPTVDAVPSVEESLIESDPEVLPNDFLAGILAGAIKNQVPKSIRMSSICIDRVGSSFRFCIVGTTSEEELRTLYEQHREHPGRARKK